MDKMPQFLPFQHFNLTNFPYNSRFPHQQLPLNYYLRSYSYNIFIINYQSNCILFSDYILRSSDLFSASSVTVYNGFFIYVFEACNEPKLYDYEEFLFLRKLIKKHGIIMSASIYKAPKYKSF